MLPPVAGYKWTPLSPTMLPEPVEVEFVFSGGPFDGHKSTATVNCELSDQITVVMKNDDGKYLYRYAGENTFKYENVHV